MCARGPTSSACSANATVRPASEPAVDLPYATAVTRLNLADAPRETAPVDAAVQVPAAAALPPADPPAARYVAVEGRSPGNAAEDAASQSASVKTQLLGAAQRAAIAALPLPASLLLAIWLLGAWALGSLFFATSPFAGQSMAPGPWMWALLWVLATPPVALALGLLPTRNGRSHAAGSQLAAAHWLALLQAAALCLAVLVWGVSPAWRAPLVALAWVWALGTAVAMAPWRDAALAVLWLPMLCGAAAAQGSVAPTAWLAAALMATVAAVALVLLRHRTWHRNQRRRLILEARARLLQKERDAALRADQDKSRFVAIASHDLRQPVHALGLFAATLQKRLMHTPDEALARNFLRAVDDLEHSFSSMLDMSRLDGGGATPLMHTFPLRDLFRRLHMQYAGQAELSGLGLRFSPGGRSVTSDPQLLERIIGNLIQNAVKYTTHGGVVVVARGTRSHVNVEVWDTGAGISHADLPRVFQEFYQVAPGRRDRSHGLGMGLSIVKRLTELLGHRLEVASRAGRGTMFRVGIAIGGLPGIQDSLAPADTVPMQALTPQMVLIVEDEEPIREGLRVLLREWGYQTITAASAAEAEQAVLALEGRVDLVLSDLQLGHSADGLPGMDGAAVVDNVRRLCGYPVPAVIVTGDTSAEAARRLASRGDPVLFKPVQPRRLFDAMRAVLG
jgi:two-component system, sensor histidine kinase